MVITWPSNTTDIVDQIRDAIGREIMINYTVSGIPCTASGCYLDPVTNLSTNQFCTVCGGNYWLNDTLPYTVDAHVRSLSLDQPFWAPGGRVMEGDLLVQIKYTPSGLYAVENSVSYIVDSKTFIMKHFDLRGVPQPNRIVVTLKEKDG